MPVEKLRRIGRKRSRHRRSNNGFRTTSGESTQTSRSGNTPDYPYIVIRHVLTRLLYCALGIGPKPHGTVFSLSYTSFGTFMNFSWFPFSIDFRLPSLAPPVSIQRRFISFILKRTLGHLLKPGQLDVAQIDAQIGSGFVEVKDLEIDDSVRSYTHQSIYLTYC